MTRLAVVLFNLGGPDNPDSIRPFLFNLFNDKAIIAAPLPIRFFLAQFISRRREKEARAIYQHIGGASPLLRYTKEQATDLETKLQDMDLPEVDAIKTFIAMRYWHPLTEATVKEVMDWGADEVLLLPLYPQYSAATSGSSINAWKRAATAAALPVKTKAICCYPQSGGFPGAQAYLIVEKLQQRTGGKPMRLLFSAHGLPQKMIDAGDPYQSQIEASAKAIADELQSAGSLGEFQDWRISYQSRVGPLEWIKPYTEDEIRAAGKLGLGIMVVPIAFVSEHSETLVELDIEYGKLAQETGVPEYLRAPAVCTHDSYISGLADLVRASRENNDAMQGHCEGGVCAANLRQCPRRIMAPAD